ncbi:sulfite oxidase [Calothrix sp. PCC 6303]|uniref:sulfite oxidase n=1 Tax=Calothrix sp. PCC 6303 TaxID=1170562 RepID=UPI0002A057E4|nr:sulfite oxidase [Calothrix sp. PCC 6303]AFZ01122.1 Sulfite oxidase [Calothrix sp. PCC 6303]
MSEKELFEQEDYLKSRIDEYIYQKSREHQISKRHFLQILAATVGGSIITGFSSSARAETIIKPQKIVKAVPANYISHSQGTLEMNWGEMYQRGYIVPNSLFYVHNRSAPPAFDPATWQLKISGTGVAQPCSLSYDQVITMSSRSVICAIECTANGRRFFEEAYNRPVPGANWRLGAIGVAEWTGVPLATLLELAKVKSTARDVQVIGADLDSLDGKGTNTSNFNSVIPIAKAKSADSLLAYAMNGEPLPPDHGRPCRVILPGWSGNAHVKWITEIVVSESPIYTPWVTEQMVLKGADYPVAEKYQGKLVTYQNVKSAFELPWDTTLVAKKYLLRGRSWSGLGNIRRVEVSLNGGNTWQLARMQEPNLPYAWVRWDIDWHPIPGKYILQARATDSKGNTQPLTVPWNDGGLLYGGVVSHPVTVVG